jgi:hypothetical protein
MSGEVDVSAQTGFAGFPKELEQVGAFRLARAPADQDDEAGTRALRFGRALRLRQKVIAVAADQDEALSLGMEENLFVRRSHGQCVCEKRSLVSPVSQNVPDFRRHVVVEKEPHDGGPAICSATRASISVL